MLTANTNAGARTAPGGSPPPAGARGETARLTAALLAAAGLRVSGPGPAGGARHLAVTSAGARYRLHVTDDGHAELHSDEDDPRRAADVAAALLGAPGTARCPDAASVAGITFKGVAAMDLKAKGLDVALNVYTDDYYGVTGDIAATNPAGGAGTVYITDEGGLTWFRDLAPRRRRMARRRAAAPDPAAAAAVIAAAVTRALNAAGGDPASRFVP